MSKNSSNLSTLCRRAAALLATLALLAAMTLPVYAEAWNEASLQTTENVADVTTDTENDSADVIASEEFTESENTETNGEDELPAEDPAQETPIDDIEDTTDTAGETTDTDIADDTKDAANTQPADEAESTTDAIATQPAEVADDGIALYDVQYPFYIYFAVPENFNDNYEVRFNARQGDNAWTGERSMALVQNSTYLGRKVYSIQITSDMLPYKGFHEIKFEYYNGGNNFSGEVGTDSKWKEPITFANKLFDGETKTWVEYTPFDPTDHTTFSGKKMAFKNATSETLANVVAHFYEKDASGKLVEVETRDLGNVGAGEKKEFNIPGTEKPCGFVQLTADGKDISALYNFYGQEVADGEESFLFDEDNRYCFVYSAKASNWTTGEGRTIYYDATFSKVAIDTKYSIPYVGGDVYYYAYKEGTNTYHTGKMTSLSDDVYAIDITDDCNKIIFASYENISPGNLAGLGDSTAILTIPSETDCVFPCYYADTSDACTYSGGNQRDGYWAELDTFRNAEKQKEGKTVVNVPESTFKVDSGTKYINSTLYDYYTDWELNGNNRDNYATWFNTDDGQGNTFANATNAYRNWVTFGQFDQALSDYYQNSTQTVLYPMYTGQFQPAAWDDGKLWGFGFADVANKLNLYGYDDVNKFMAVNNSTINVNGEGLAQGSTRYYAYTFQGLTGDKLIAGEPVLYGTNLTVPYFNKDFLLKSNSKNAKLGEVYEDVSFPFTKKSVFLDNEDKGVDYWHFDSNETTLYLQKDTGDSSYFLQSNNDREKSRNLKSNSNYQDGAATYGFFPFNGDSTAKQASTYNYGFGAKLQFQFTLTDDGQVYGADGKTKVPIKFFFSGDDDVWVYIDDELALDVGGDHGKASGLLQFGKNSSGNLIYTPYVSQVKTGNTEQSYTYSSGCKTIEYLNEGNTITFNYKGTEKTLTPGTHTLTMYYMERGMWESNMAIAFNFPDHNELQVEKQVDVSEVNELFQDCFKNQKLFNFTIENQATHYGTTLANGDPVKTINLLDPAKSNPTQTNSFTAEPATKNTGDGNIFKTVAANGSPGGTPADTTVLKWYAQYKDLTPSAGSNKEKRYGMLTLNNAIDISAMSYLSFDIYVDSNEGNASLSNMYLQLQDENKHARGCLDQTFLNGAIYGSVTMKNNEWVTVKLDLSKMKAVNGFDNKNVTKLLFGCNYPRYIYLRNIVFSAKAVPTVITGFTTAQEEIADYGSASSGTLMPAKNAQYTSDKESGTMLVDENGGFVLQDGETITFKDQFRRGSYLSINEQVDKNLYDTEWTIFENGQAVAQTNVGNQEKMTLKDNTVVGLKDQEGTAPDDGRVEKQDAENANNSNAQQGNNYKEGKPDANTLVFRSYLDPDASDANGLTKLKVLFVNKVKTGSLTIYKQKDTYSEPLDGVYKFEVRFTNVGGHALGDKEITWEVDLKAGESKTLEGIPVGTRFTIEEVAPNDDSKLVDVSITGGGEDREVMPDNTVRGSISGTDTAQAKVTFTNSIQDTLDITGTKQWKNADGTEMTEHPTTICVQLQRRHVNETSEDAWTVVKYQDKDYTPVEQNYAGMNFSFLNLPAKDYSQTDTPYFEYRVVEGYVDEKGFHPVEDGKTITIGDKVYGVTYATDKTPSTDSNVNAKQTVTITNQLKKPKFTLDVIKKDAENNETLLANVEFTLEKVKADSNGDWIVDGSFEKRTGITNSQGELMLKNAEGEMSDIQGFKDLDAGTYRLTETKAAENYSLLSAPILIIFDENGRCQVGDDLINGPDGRIFTGDAVHGYKLALTVLNRKIPTLPHTGADAPSLWLLIGLPLAVAGLLILVFRYNKKGGRTR